MSAQRGSRFIVSGRVQGVGFRAWVARQARALNVSGHARNLDDGTVEVVAIGAGGSVLSLADSLEKGPALARVDAVRNAGAVSTAAGTGFCVR